MRISILGIKISVVDMPTTLNLIEGFIADGRPHMVVTADASCAVMAETDRALREIVNSADLVTPDSVGVLWAARKFGTPLPERVSGVDIVDRLCARCAETGHSIFLLGAAPGVTDDAAKILAEQYPGLVIAGTYHGYFSPEEETEVVRKVRDARPDVLFVAMGIPRQEKWIKQHMEDLAVPVSMGVGGTFDVLSGRVKRAPEWAQRRGLEWAHRLASNPKKIRKCMTLPVFVLLVLRALVFGRKEVSDV
ncbi:MAG: WecB/TagA/CpsF family glycosyltransferase [Armatimonadota bacterium]